MRSAETCRDLPAVTRGWTPHPTRANSHNSPCAHYARCTAAAGDRSRAHGVLHCCCGAGVLERGGGPRAPQEPLAPSLGPCEPGGFRAARPHVRRVREATLKHARARCARARSSAMARRAHHRTRRGAAKNTHDDPHERARASARMCGRRQTRASAHATPRRHIMTHASRGRSAHPRVADAVSDPARLPHLTACATERVTHARASTARPARASARARGARDQLPTAGSSRRCRSAARRSTALAAYDARAASLRISRARSSLGRSGGALPPPPRPPRPSPSAIWAANATDAPGFGST